VIKSLEVLTYLLIAKKRDIELNEEIETAIEEIYEEALPINFTYTLGPEIKRTINQQAHATRLFNFETNKYETGTETEPQVATQENTQVEPLSLSGRLGPPVFSRDTSPKPIKKTDKQNGNKTRKR
jgi:hypothetical protein